MHEPINDIGRFALGGADDLVMPEEVPLIDEGIGTDPSVLAEILEGIVGIERLNSNPYFWPSLEVWSFPRGAGRPPGVPTGP